MSSVSDRHERVSRLFLAACDLPEDERRAYLEAECGDDAALIDEVLALVDEDSHADETTDGLHDVLAFGSPHPDEVGRYRVLSVIGEGGMGVVYRAQQAAPERIVALKVIRPGYASPEVLRRFLREVRVLGQLDHAGIARIHEAGTWESESGPRPYFAMELVQGVPLTQFARERELGLRERLVLISKVCDAIHHAHAAGIVHRDLKPANILVTDEGQPKVLDFGVARASGDESSAATRMTMAGQVIGTVPYMSPEQLTGSFDIDARTDVYAVSVLTYELLTGQLPLPLRNVTLAEAMDTVRDKQPTRLGFLDPRMRGDVETIVAKALSKDPGERYATAADMGRDVDRHLQDVPIAARPPSLVDRARKFTRRHRVLVAATCAIVIALVAATAVSLNAARTARRAAHESELEVAKANAVREFLEMMLQSADPFAADGHASPDTTIGEMLDMAATWVDTSFPDQPEVELSARLTMASTFKGLTRYADAREQLEASLELARGLGQDPPRKELHVRARLAMLDSLEGHHEDARAALVEVVDAERDELGAGDPATLSTRANLVLVLKELGQLERAEAEGRTTVDLCREHLAADHETRGAAALNLASILRARDPDGAGEEALSLYSEALEVYSGIYGDEHPSVAMLINNIARLHLARGDLERAGEGFADAADRLERSLRRPHRYVGTVWHNLGFVQHEQGQLEAADRSMLRALAAYEGSIGADHPEALSTVYAHAFVLYDLGRIDEAAAMWESFADAMEDGADAPPPKAVLARAYACEGWSEKGRHTEAIAALLGHYSGLVEREGADGRHAKAVARALGRVYAAAGQAPEAERYQGLGAR